MQQDLKTLLSDEDLEEMNRTNEGPIAEMNVMRGQLEALKGKMMSFLRERAESERDLVGNMDDGRSIASSQSVTSSVRARLLEKKIEEEMQKAKAGVELSALRRRRELERRQQELQWEIAELELQTRIDASQVQTEVAARHEAALAELEGSTNDARQPSNPAHQVQKPQPSTNNARQPSNSPHQVQQPRPEPVDRLQMTPADSSVSEVLTNLSRLMTEQTKRNQLPVLEPEVFTGDIEEFSAWLTSFECYIEARTQSPMERLHYLSVYTGGEAHKAIQGLLLPRSDNAYIHTSKAEIRGSLRQCLSESKRV